MSSDVIPLKIFVLNFFLLLNYFFRTFPFLSKSINVIFILHAEGKHNFARKIASIAKSTMKIQSVFEKFSVS
eukprot:TRINITY_DN861_c1_g1_i1.p1 TRINITY_DN861_c1_g1~~TRINITY_DN861_c1_g1_i1.p1  ORF type:complete len:72 (+),score=5.59 TRINITY_DN861_c1_g1_i1:33-248(+)